MVITCCVPGCSSRGSGIPYFRVPFTNAQRLEAWLGACNFLDRYEKYQLESVRFCVLHFNPQFINDKRRLTSDAIPTLNLPASSRSNNSMGTEQPTNSQQYLLITPIQPGKDLEIKVTHVPTDPDETHINLIEPSIVTVESMAVDLTDPVPHGMDVDENLVPARHEVTPLQPSDPGTSSLEQQPLHLEPTVIISNAQSSTAHTPAVSPTKASHSIQTTPVHIRSINRSRQVITRRSTEAREQQRVRLNPLDITPRKRKLRMTNKIIKTKLSHSIKQQRLWKSKALEYNKMIKRYPLLSNFGKVLVDSQLRLSGIAAKGRRYTEEEKIFALSLYKLSPRTYNYLRHHLALPCKTNLNELLTNIPLRPGINDFIFQHLEDVSRNFSQQDRQAVLLFDEMAIDKRLFFNFQTGVIEGLQDLGNGERTKDLADKALVFMLRGLANQWKIPIAFYFVRDGIKTFILKQFIQNLILAVMKAGFTVRATISDQGTPNVAAIKSLISDARTRILRENSGRADDIFHYEVKDDQNQYHTVYHIYDVPHLLKCFRNNFQKKNIILADHRAKWEYIEKLYAVDGCGGVARATKLTDKHVNPKGYDKMKVKLAAQVFSRGVSSSLTMQMSTQKSMQGDHSYITDPNVDIENGYFTAEILLFINDLFDSLNGFGHSRNKLRNALSLNSAHMDFWNEAVKKLESMRFDASNEIESRPPSLKHFVHDIKTIRRIWNDLKGIGFKFLSLRRLNQDPLENFFGQIRGQGGFHTNPDPHAFVSAYKTLLINNITTGKSLYANCANDRDKMLGSLQSLIHNRRYSPYTDDSVHLNNSISEEIGIPSENALQAHSISYIAGAICRSILPKIGCVDCNECRNALLSDAHDSSHALIEIREYNPAKHSLCYPSARLSRLVWECMFLTNTKLSEVCNVYIYTEILSTFERQLDVSWITCTAHKDSFLKALWLFVIRMQGRQWCTNFNNRVHGVDSRRKGAEMESLIASKVSKGTSYRSKRRSKSISQ